MALFNSKPAKAKTPPTRIELINQHRRLAEDHLARAAKAGRLEAETRHATMAAAHASLALSYQTDTSLENQVAIFKRLAELKGAVAG